MKILKFKKKSKDKYELYLENNKTILLYEDVIIKNNLLLTKNIDEKTLKILQKQNNDMNAYLLAIKYISIKMRSIKELNNYLIKKGFDIKLSKEITNKLIKEGYLNDLKFTKSFINDNINLTTSGPLKIRNQLIKYGVELSTIDKEIALIDNNIITQKLNKLIDKQLKIKKGSTNSVKQKLIIYFINLGYDKSMIINELAKKTIETDKSKLLKDYNKLYNKYKNKYDSSNLLYLISQKLYLKGYTSADIKEIIGEYHG